MLDGSYPASAPRTQDLIKSPIGIVTQKKPD